MILLVYITVKYNMDILNELEMEEKYYALEREYKKELNRRLKTEEKNKQLMSAICIVIITSILSIVVYMTISYNNIRHYVGNEREIGYTTYTVKSGDTISKVIDNLQVSDEGLSTVPDRIIFDIIMKNSNIRDENHIYVGDKLYIPYTYVKGVKNEGQ